MNFIARHICPNDSIFIFFFFAFASTKFFPYYNYKFGTCGIDLSFTISGLPLITHLPMLSSWVHILQSTSTYPSVLSMKVFACITVNLIGLICYIED
jgi:hypothetical protein